MYFVSILSVFEDNIDADFLLSLKKERKRKPKKWNKHIKQIIVLQ